MKKMQRAVKVKVKERRKTKTQKMKQEIGGVCNAILGGVNICCSACQGSICQLWLTPGPLAEY